MTELLEYLNKIGEITYLSEILNWEMDTISPKNSIDYLINLQTKLNLEAFKLQTNEKYINLLNNFINSEEFNQITDEEKTMLNSMKEQYLSNKRIPKDFYENYVKTCLVSKDYWLKAKKENDYNIFKPYLNKVIELTKQLYKYKYPNSNLYDSMLNEYEKNMTSSKIDVLFNELKEEIVPIINNIKPKEMIIDEKVDKNKVLDVAKYLLEYIGFNFDKGTIGIYPHGYTTRINENDTRITFSDNTLVSDTLMTIIHEGGHGIFEQNIGNNLNKYQTYFIDKYALHESQSRFYENILGRNKNFWIPIYDDIKEILHIDIPLDSLISDLNNPKLSLIRIDSDELTYCLHIIIRYEIERDLFNGKISIDELPDIWNQKVKDYLNLDVKNDNEGLLQDIHWADGSFGYFPSYLLGSIFDGMLLEVMEERFGSIDTLLHEGRIKEITSFLNENIHKYGGEYSIDEVAKRVCKKELDVKPIVKYFKKKYIK